MAKPRTRPYGSWTSPVSASLIVAETVGLGDLHIDHEHVYWLESRPSESGRTVLVCCDHDGTARDLTPPGFNARTRVHEYGGGSYTVHAGIAYFVNFSDQGIYRQRDGTAPELVLAVPGLRFADLVVDAERERLLCVQEDHRAEGEPRNSLVAIPLNAQVTTTRELAAGHDFYASPALSADGGRIAWLCWQHPNMPWDGSQLWCARIGSDGMLLGAQRVAGSETESVFQPAWHPNGALQFVSDRSGWWNHYQYADDGTRCLRDMQAECGLPQWVFAMSTYGISANGEIVAAYNRGGNWRLGRIDPDSGALTGIDLPFTELTALRCHGRRVVCQAGSPQHPTCIIEVDLDTGLWRSLRSSTSQVIDADYLSVPRAIEFPTDSGETAHAFFYPPANRDFQAPSGTSPPLLVKSHGGPTGSTSTTLNLGTQYWTSRGFAVLDVNYRGSTGYGRAYRERLDGKWGIVDVLDCLNAARFVTGKGLADPAHTAIRGNSAGGYTTLAALTMHDFFRAGASHYGVSDLQALAQDTHKFESRYLDRLIGPWPEAREIYRQRSPIHHVDGLSVPVIFFQGLDDRVVPPSQAQEMVQALRDKGVPVAYVTYENEQHGFRQAKNVCRTLEAELYFYSKVFDFMPAEALEPVDIENLASANGLPPL